MKININDFFYKLTTSFKIYANYNFILEIYNNYKLILPVCNFVKIKENCSFKLKKKKKTDTLVLLEIMFLLLIF